MKMKQTARQYIGWSVVALAVNGALTAMAAAAPGSGAAGQDGPAGTGTGPAAADGVMATVQVTGMRSTNARSIAAKEASDVVVDTVAADQVGRLPDFNMGDALKRVTGVNVMLYQGEPRYIVVRGLNGGYNTTQIDGFALAGGDIGSRQQLMEMLPSNFASRIDVVKSFLPQYDGAAVGAVVNILTASGYSLPDHTLTLSAKGGKNLMGSQYGGATPTGEASAKWAKRFGANDEFAFLASASYWTREIYVPQIESGGTMYFFNPNGTRNATAYAGNGYGVPTQRLWYDYDDLRQRRGLTTRLDWRPSDAVSGHASAFYFRQMESADRNTQNASVNATTTVSNQTATTGTLSSVNQLIQLGRLRWERSLGGLNGELNVQLARDWSTDVRASVSRTTVDNPQMFDNYTQSNMPFNYDWSGAGPVFTPVNAANAANPALYGFTQHQSTEQNYVSKVRDLQWNVKHNMGDEARGLGMAFGLRTVRSDIDSAYRSVFDNGKPFTLADVTRSSTLCGLQCANMLLIDPDRVDAMFKMYAAAGSSVVNIATQYASTYGVAERVNAAYVQGRFKANDWMVSGGVRTEETQDAMTGWNQANNIWTPVAREHSERKWLPSVVGVYQTGVSSKLRMGLSQSIGRPRWDQLATTGGVLSTGLNPTLTLGNTALKPRSSNNVDLGHDWYLDGGRGIMSVGLFRKDIKDEIFTWGENTTMDIGGVPTTVLVTQPRNATGKVHLSGVELGLTRDLDFITPALRGFGVSANATFTRVQYPVTLQNGATTTTRTLSTMPQRPSQQWNLTLYYERDRIRSRLAWNHVGTLWDDRYPNYTVAGFYANRFQQATNNVDYQFSFDVTKKLAFSLDVINVTGQSMQYQYGSNQEKQQSAWKLAPSVLIGLNYKM
jgi:TonB-dependent receptor